MSTRADGIDVSRWNVLDISHLLIGKEFAFVRASIGTQTDPEYAHHMNDVRDAHIIGGAYHYLVPPGPGDGRQAQAFLRALRQTQFQPTFLALDVESSALHYPTVARGWINYVRANDPLKRKILLYSSEGTWPGNLGQDGNWVANFTRGLTQPHMPWKFWQYSNNGNHLDTDVFNGTPADLKVYAHG